MIKSTATIRDVAREAEVSVASVSRALNGHVNVRPELRRRVLAAADKLDYVPHVGARSLTMARTDTIGVMLPDLSGAFFSEIIRGVDRAAQPAGQQLLLSSIHGDADHTARAIRAMRGRVDGLLLMAPDLDADFLATQLPGGLPTVVINGRRAGLGQGGIAIDNRAGACAMVAHLVARGYRRIAHLAGPEANFDAQERRDGFCAAMVDLTGNRDPIIVPGDFSEEAGRAAAERFLSGAFAADAVFAANDMMAVGFAGVLEDAGVAVPGRIAIAGFDDIPIARYVPPGLTTMRVHIADIGTRAFEMLRAIGGDDADAPPQPTVMVAPELVVRGSTG